ncbi:MAG: prolyl oligopeptidase family serine peptidase [Candidatus Sulfotelmatobacter sp.]
MFDIRDRQHYVYTLADTALQHKVRDERHSAVIVGNSRSLFSLLFPDDPRLDSRRRCLWAVIGGKRFEVKHNSEPVVPDGAVGLSPDGGLLVATLAAPEVPMSWKVLYPPPYVSDPDRYHGGAMHQYVLINLQKGSIQSLADAPISSDAGSWAWVFAGPSWSDEGQSILLPGTFLSSNDNVPSRPCIAVADLRSNTCSCVEQLKGHTEKDVEVGYHGIKDARFIGGDGRRVVVISRNRSDSSLETAKYARAGDGTWRLTSQIIGTSEVGAGGLEITLVQGLNEAPMIVATMGQASRTIWDPNPQIKNIELGEAGVYEWRDKEGRAWRGGLYKPTKFKNGQRYPLVIQTHGFLEPEFVPSGVYPTAFAARELAAMGIVVLQVREQCPEVTVYEGPCAVSGYEGAANQLTAEGLVDPRKIGIIGFSRTGFYVMETLTTSSIHFKAAAVTDSFMLDYFQYILNPDRGAYEDNAMIGAPPFGEGLQQWVKRSPSFNLDKITSPLLLVGSGPLGMLFMWGPYAGLHCLHRPVDLVMLKTHEHILANPAIRMASQGGTVDWFRFWLKGEEDQDPTKAQQYTRWRALRKLQAENEDKSGALPDNSN